MKIRMDFVTNSSSSSFIIGKKDDAFVDIEYVYQKIRDLYKEYYDKINAVVDYLKENPKIPIEYKKDSSGRFMTFQFTKDNKWDKNRAISEAIERDFGVSIWDYIRVGEYEWVDNCNTYEEYEAYWQEKMKVKDYHVHAPFTIADFLEPKPAKWLHYYVNPEYATSEDYVYSVDITSDVLRWYFPYLEDCLTLDIGCKDCPEKDSWCDKEACGEAKMKYKNHEFTRDNACLNLLGRVCIYSECGYIPDYVVKKLSEISEYSCNHMG